MEDNKNKSVEQTFKDEKKNPSAALICSVLLLFFCFFYNLFQYVTVNFLASGHTNP